MSRYLAGLVLVGLVALAASQALAGDPVPVVVNGRTNPAGGQVVAQYERRADGTCDLGTDGLTLTATPDAGETGAVAVELDDTCRAVIVAAGDDPGPAPDGRTVHAAP